MEYRLRLLRAGSFFHSPLPHTYDLWDSRYFYRGADDCKKKNYLRPFKALGCFIADIRSLDALSSRSCFYRFHHVRPLQRDRRTTDFFMADNPILRIAFFFSNTVIFWFFQKIYPAKPK